MNWEQVISTVVIPVTVMLVMHYFGARTYKASPKSIHGKHVLQFRILYAIIGYVFLLVSLLWLGMSLFFLIVGTMLSIVLLCITLLFGGFGVRLLTLYYNHRVTFDDHQIEVSYSLKENQRFTWEEIQDVKRNSFLGNASLFLTDGRKVKIHIGLTGMGFFLDQLKAKRGISP